MGKELIKKDVYGFNACYYKAKTKSNHAIILALGPNFNNPLINLASKYFVRLGFNVLAIGPKTKDGYYDVEIDDFKDYLIYLRKQGNLKFGIAGASATAMLALVVASYYPEISLTLALSPCDFIMEGYYRDGLDGAKERPADGHSFFKKSGVKLPYLQFAYRHPDYWNKIQEESKRTKNLISTIEMFKKSLELNKLTEDCLIKVEKIKGLIVFVAAKDDCLWDTSRYISRMNERLISHKSNVKVTNLIYEHGTHFLFPQSMVANKLPLADRLIVKAFKAGRTYPKECHQARIDLDKKLKNILKNW